MRRPQRSTLWVAVAVLVGIGGFVSVAAKLDGTVETRREIAAEQRAEERRRSEATDLRLCEIAINGTRADFLHLVESLTAVAPPPSDDEEARQRAETQRIIAEQYRPVDCAAFVAASERGDQP